MYWRDDANKRRANGVDDDEKEINVEEELRAYDSSKAF